MPLFNSIHLRLPSIGRKQGYLVVKRCEIRIFFLSLQEDLIENLAHRKVLNILGLHLFGSIIKYCTKFASKANYVLES